MNITKHEAVAKMLTAVLEGVHNYGAKIYDCTAESMVDYIAKTGLKFAHMNKDPKLDVIGHIDGHHILTAKQLPNHSYYHITYTDELKLLKGFDHGDYQDAIEQLITDFDTLDQQPLSEVEISTHVEGD